MRYNKNKNVYLKLLKGKLCTAEIENLLAPIQFSNWHSAYKSLARVANKYNLHHLLADLLPTLFQVLENSAYPERSLINFERFIEKTDNRNRFFQSFKEEPRLIELLVTLFAGSQFLSEILLLHPTYIEKIKDTKNLALSKSKEQLLLEAKETISEFKDFHGKVNALRKFQRLEILRIGTGDLLNIIDFQLVVAQLSDLADIIVENCLNCIANNLKMQSNGFSVFALGKLGGKELNYSSDIDLLFLSKDSNRRYQQLGEKLIEELTRSTVQGFFYRVDMDLRPWGKTGKLVPNIEEHLQYLQKHARFWEKQAMLKIRFIAGDESFGNQFLRKSWPLILKISGHSVRKIIRSMKENLEQTLSKRGYNWGEVKSGIGSIRDIEFITQYLQLSHGAKNPEIHNRNTLNALDRLATCNIIPLHEHRVLADGYTFLRSVEHHLQIMHYRQTHILPEKTRELNYLARRIGFQGMNRGKQLVQRYQQHRDAIRSIYLHYLGEDKQKKETDSAIPPLDLEITSHISRMDKSYSHAFTEEEIERHVELVNQLTKGKLLNIEAVPFDNKIWKVTIVAYDYLGELSLICGLLFVYGFDIIDGNIFTYEPIKEKFSAENITSQLKNDQLEIHSRTRQKIRKKIVDVFTVRAVTGKIDPQLWTEYQNELSHLLQLLRRKRQREAQGHLAKRVAEAIQKYSTEIETLLPVEIEIDNSISDDHTVLRIDAPDTIGFLFEFTNALALNGIYISRVMVSSLGQRVHDTLFVTDGKGQKITDPKMQRQLRIATALVKHFTHLLPHSSNPESALLNFRELISKLFTQPDWQSELASLERPEILDALVKIFGVSDFLWDDFLRMQHENLFPIIQNLEKLSASKSKISLKKELNEKLKKAYNFQSSQNILNEFKDREIFRIDMRYIMSYLPNFWKFSEELSNLAEVVVESASQICINQLVQKFGKPKLENNKACRSSVCAVGKFGGRELGFASDIELLFIYFGKGQTTGKKKITNAEFFEKLVQEFTQTIKTKREGIFEIDLQLRPYGRAGSKAVSLESFRNYFSSNGAAWEYERQALVKLRPVAGDRYFGKQLLAIRDKMLYESKSYDIAAIRAIRERQMRELVAGGTINAKFSPGALVDLEYLVQALQITHGHKDTTLRYTNTNKALKAIFNIKIISKSDFTKLNEAHIFLRKLIEALRIVRGSAKELTVPPTKSEEFAFLAKRLNYYDTSDLWDDIVNYTDSVQKINKRILG